MLLAAVIMSSTISSPLQCICNRKQGRILSHFHWDATSEYCSTPDPDQQMRCSVHKSVLNTRKNAQEINTLSQLLLSFQRQETLELIDVLSTKNSCRNWKNSKTFLMLTQSASNGIIWVFPFSLWLSYADFESVYSFLGMREVSRGKIKTKSSMDPVVSIFWSNCRLISAAYFSFNSLRFLVSEAVCLFVNCLWCVETLQRQDINPCQRLRSFTPRHDH